MGRLSTSTVLTTCSASLRTSLPRLWGRWARTWKGPPPARQHPTPPGAREAEAPLGLCPETPSSPSVSVFHPPCAQGCQGPLCSKGPLCFRSQCSQPFQALRHPLPCAPSPSLKLSPAPPTEPLMSVDSLVTALPPLGLCAGRTLGPMLPAPAAQLAPSTPRCLPASSLPRSPPACDLMPHSLSPST